METKKVGPFGGQGGSQWDDGAYTTVRKLIVICGTVIDSIQIEYDKNGESILSSKHGGTGGHKHHEVKLDYPNEYIISISGHHKLYNTGNYVVHSLKIETNKKIYGPFGTEEGNSFSIPASGSKIVGFYGRSGIYIDSIGAYVAPIPISHPYESVGPFGGQGGNQWDDGTYTTIRQLRVNCGTVIDSIQIEYDKNGESVWSAKHGGTGGHKHHEVKLDYPNEYIISISGHHKLYNTGNYVVHSLKIETNKKTYGPFGTEEGNSFSIPTSGGKIVGFFGRSGIYIDSIGVYVAPIPISPPIERFGLFGGQGGNLWDDGVNTTIRAIDIAYGEIIDSIRFEYDRNGNSVWSEKHGESMGGNKLVVKLNPDEFITSISGYHNRYSTGPFVGYIVCSLKIQSNKKTYGPYGTEKGQYFSFPTSNGKIVGFFGRSGTYIDAIGGYAELSIPDSKKYETVGPFGGLSGNLWDDGVNTTIRQIEIASGEIIDSIRIEYDKNGSFVWSEQHGESLGGNKSVVKLDPDEFVVSISGYHRKYSTGAFVGHIVSSLKIKTNKKTYGPFGKEVGNPFSFPTSGGKIVGLHGKSGTYIDSIGAYVVQD